MLYIEKLIAEAKMEHENNLIADEHNNKILFEELQAEFIPTSIAKMLELSTAVEKLCIKES